MSRESRVAYREDHAASLLPMLALLVGLLLGTVLAFSLGVPQRLVAMVFPARAAHALDGRMEPGEYRFQWIDRASSLDFRWSIQGDRIIGAVFSPDTGWVAVGFAGEGPLMFGADIVIGAVDSGGARVRDHFADSPTNQTADTALGTRDDIVAGAGSEGPAGTTIEFERPLAARDSMDRAIGSFQTNVMLASAESDDFTAYHAGGRKAVALLDLFNGPPAGAPQSLIPTVLTDVQIMLATWMTIMLLVAIHGISTNWAARDFMPAEEEAASTRAATALIAVAIVAELLALGVFGVGVAVSAPTWILGLSLALGLLALTAIIVLYSRAFVRWEVVRSERDDGVPW